MSLQDILASRQSALTVEKVAKFLNVSERLVYDRVSKGRVPYFKVGSAIRFDPQILADRLKKRLRILADSADEKCDGFNPNAPNIWEHVFDSLEWLPD